MLALMSIEGLPWAKSCGCLHLCECTMQSYREGVSSPHHTDWEVEAYQTK
jgi:hypothetical protein